MIAWLDFLEDYIQRKENGEFEEDKAVFLQFFEIDSVMYSATWDGEQIVVLEKGGDADNAIVFLNGRVRVKPYYEKCNILGLPVIYITEGLSSALDSCVEWDWTVKEYADAFDSMKKDCDVEIEEVRQLYEEKMAIMIAEHSAVQNASSFALKAARSERNSIRSTLDMCDRAAASSIVETSLKASSTVFTPVNFKKEFGTDNSDDELDRTASGGSRSSSDAGSIELKKKSAKKKEKEKEKKRKSGEKKEKDKSKKETGVKSKSIKGLMNL